MHSTTTHRIHLAIQGEKKNVEYKQNKKDKGLLDKVHFLLKAKKFGPLVLVLSTCASGHRARDFVCIENLESLTTLIIVELWGLMNHGLTKQTLY